MAKLVYGHERRETISLGGGPCHPHHFAGLYEKSKNLWYEVLDYSDKYYGPKKGARIFLCGDGASWIKKGLSLILQSVFVLNRFHPPSASGKPLTMLFPSRRNSEKRFRKGPGRKLETLSTRPSPIAPTPKQRNTFKLSLSPSPTTGRVFKLETLRIPGYHCQRCSSRQSHPLCPSFPPPYGAGEERGRSNELSPSHEVQ